MRSKTFMPFLLSGTGNFILEGPWKGGSTNCFRPCARLADRIPRHLVPEAFRTLGVWEKEFKLHRVPETCNTYWRIIGLCVWVHSGADRIIPTDRESTTVQQIGFPSCRNKRSFVSISGPIARRRAAASPLTDVCEIECVSGSLLCFFPESLALVLSLGVGECKMHLGDAVSAVAGRREVARVVESSAVHVSRIKERAKQSCRAAWRNTAAEEAFPALLP